MERDKYACKNLDKNDELLLKRRREKMTNSDLFIRFSNRSS